MLPTFPLLQPSASSSPDSQFYRFPSQAAHPWDCDWLALGWVSALVSVKLLRWSLLPNIAGDVLTTKKWFIVDLKFTSNGASCILSGNPNPFPCPQSKLSASLVIPPKSISSPSLAPHFHHYRPNPSHHHPDSGIELRMTSQFTFHWTTTVIV